MSGRDRRSHENRLPTHPMDRANPMVSQIPAGRFSAAISAAPCSKASTAIQLEPCPAVHAAVLIRPLPTDTVGARTRKVNMQNVMAATVAAASTSLIPPDGGPVDPILCQLHSRLCEKMVVPEDRVHVPLEGVEGTRPGNGARRGRMARGRGLEPVGHRLGPHTRYHIASRRAEPSQVERKAEGQAVLPSCRDAARPCDRERARPSHWPRARRSGPARPRNICRSSAEGVGAAPRAAHAFGARHQRCRGRCPAVPRPAPRAAGLPRFRRVDAMEPISHPIDVHRVSVDHANLAGGRRLQHGPRVASSSSAAAASGQHRKQCHRRDCCQGLHLFSSHSDPPIEPRSQDSIVKLHMRSEPVRRHAIRAARTPAHPRFAPCANQVCRHRPVRDTRNLHSSARNIIARSISKARQAAPGRRSRSSATCWDPRRTLWCRLRFGCRRGRGTVVQAAIVACSPGAPAAGSRGCDGTRLPGPGRNRPGRSRSPGCSDTAPSRPRSPRASSRRGSARAGA